MSKVKEGLHLLRIKLSSIYPICFHFQFYEETLKVKYVLLNLMFWYPWFKLLHDEFIVAQQHMTVSAPLHSEHIINAGNNVDLLDYILIFKLMNVAITYFSRKH